ncbi:MAG: GGDEF domain-containing protein [Mariniblastus sp.]
MNSPSSAQSISNLPRRRTAARPKRAFSLKNISLDGAIKFCENVEGIRAALALVVYALTVGILDHTIGDEHVLAMFYLPIICFLTIRISLNSALSVSIVCAIVWLVDDIVLESAEQPTRGEILAASIHFLCFSVIATFLFRLAQALEKEKRLARYDHLTGLPNMHAFNEQADELLAGQPPGTTPTSIAFIDCDNFKTVNDTLGHNEGDNLLVAVGKVLNESTRDGDCVSRYGGDEFVILLSNTGKEKAFEILTRIKQSLDQSMLQNYWPVTFSMGIATFLSPTDSIESAIHKADEMMYERKRHNKNGISSQVFE